MYSKTLYIESDIFINKFKPFFYLHLGITEETSECGQGIQKHPKVFWWSEHYNLHKSGDKVNLENGHSEATHGDTQQQDRQTMGWKKPGAVLEMWSH